MKQLSLGTLAPDFTLPALDGSTFRLQDALAGGPLVLAFFKVACPTSQFTLPYLQKSGQPRIWLISQDDPADTVAFMERFGLSLPVLLDEHPYAVSAAYDIEYVPAIFEIGPQGMIRVSDYAFSKATLSKIAGFDMFPGDDGIPATRPG